MGGGDWGYGLGGLNGLVVEALFFLALSFGKEGGRLKFQPI